MKMSSMLVTLRLTIAVLLAALPLAFSGCNNNSSTPAKDTSADTNVTVQQAPPPLPALTDTSAPATTTATGTATPVSESSKVEKVDSNAAPSTPAAPSEDSKK